MTSATLEKPLTRESLVNPDAHLSTPEGSGLFAAQTPRLPRIHANRVFSSPSGELLSIRFNYKPRFRRLSTVLDQKTSTKSSSCKPVSEKRLDWQVAGTLVRPSNAVDCDERSAQAKNDPECAEQARE